MDVKGITLLVRRADNGGAYTRISVGGYVRSARKAGDSCPRLYRIARVESTGGTGASAMRVTLENAMHGSTTKRTPATLKSEFVFVRDALVEPEPEVVPAGELERLAS